MNLTLSKRFARPYNVTSDGTHYHPETDPALVEVLERLRHQRSRIRLFLGNPKAGEVWDEENDVSGRLGRSTGPCKVPLIIHSNANGGPALLDHCVVAVMTSPGYFAWKAPEFNPGRWTISTDPRVIECQRFAAASLRDGRLVGRHETVRGAHRFCDFMSGRRMTA